MTEPATPKVDDFVSRWSAAKLLTDETLPWIIISSLSELVERQLRQLGRDYLRDGDVAVHESATVEHGAIIKGPTVIGANCFVAGTAYLRGGIFLDEDCIIGPGAELKTSLMFKGSKLAHLNFVGDSILGSDVNVEAGAIIANYRNEMDDKEIKLTWQGKTLLTGSLKFGALVGDGTRIGANAVIAPGAIIEKRQVVPRLSLVDQYPKLR